MAGGLDPAKLLMILLVALIVIGPEKLPRVARQIGGWWRELAKVRERFEAEVREAMPDIDIPKIPRLPPRGITGYLTSMMSTTTKGAEASGALSSDVLGEDGSTGYASAGSAVRPQQAWVSSRSMPESDSLEAVPAGWSVVGAESPGYATGSVLAPVPTVAVGGPLSVESELNFDDPGWN